ncbi:transglutaminase family protein [Synechococcus sp. BSF8S]|uniref:transglutaminase family protein n=1 Tax=Synechococcales TaxID=1890424 RepID=UPI0016279F3B|nr:MULTISPECIES: transglutaminase family protein [unclassified Synechococcus]MBC1260483.1 transglutaminase family protein [Synechococcus sp. BSF8S]MBC1263854.1 transglutaminase family protein [Synechococcus sp. BSA11S]
MQRFRILHRTLYTYGAAVRLEPHALRLRPREGHELRIESSSLRISPPATLRWHRDVEDNSVAMASFSSPAAELLIESELVVQQYHQEPLDFLVDEEAVLFPFRYSAEDRLLLAPYRQEGGVRGGTLLMDWVAGVHRGAERMETYALLERISARIHNTLRYQRREEPGVQTAEHTLAAGSGSCRDFATLFMAATRQLGFAARFVSGYLHDSAAVDGSTHAWAEVYLPGAGWTGFDPTIGALAGPDHMVVAVARHPEAVPPVEGAFVGPSGSTLSVGVWVTELEEPLIR